MSALSIEPTYPTFTDSDGSPLDDGYVWIGAAGSGDPIGNPQTAYWDAALTQVVTQPVRTRGGYPLNAGAIGRLYVAGDYSILVRNRNGYDLYSAPNATERISSELVTFLQAGANAVTRTAQSKMRDVVSVLDFGADPTGATDSTQAIQDALNSGASCVFAPQGTYLISSAITVPRGVTFYGDGSGTVDAASTKGTVILQGANAHGISFTAGTNSLDRTTVKDIMVRTSVVNSNAGVYVPFNAGDFLIEKVTVTRQNSGAGTGNRFTKAFDIRSWVGAVRSCWAHKAIDYGLYMYGPGGVSGEINAVVVDQFRANDCSNTSTSAHVYVENAEAGLTISNLYIEGSAKYGVYAKSCRGVTITNPYIETTTDGLYTNVVCLRLDDCDEMNISGGYYLIDGHVDYQLYDTQGRGHLISAAQIKGIYFNDTRCTLDGVTFSSSASSFTNVRLTTLGCRQFDSPFEINTDLYQYQVRGGDTVVRQTFVEATLDYGSIPAYSSATLDITDAKLSGISATGKNIITATPDSAGTFLEAGLVAVPLPRADSVRLRLINTTGSAIDPASRTWRIEVKVYA